MKKWLKGLLAKIARAALQATVEAATEMPPVLALGEEPNSNPTPRPTPRPTPGPTPRPTPGPAPARPPLTGTVPLVPLSIPIDPETARMRSGHAVWPPAAEDVAPGEGGGATKGVTEQHVALMGQLWTKLIELRNKPVNPDVSLVDYGMRAYRYAAAKLGWDHRVYSPSDIAPDEFYAIRLHLVDWVRAGGIEPDWANVNAKPTDLTPAPAPVQPTAPIPAPNPAPSTDRTPAPDPISVPINTTSTAAVIDSMTSTIVTLNGGL